MKLYGLGSAFTDLRDQLESAVTGSASNAITTATTPTAPKPASASLIAGMSLPVLALGGFVLWKVLNRKK